MNDRLNTPDILGSIMSGGFINKAVKQEQPQEIKQESHKEISKKDLKNTQEEDLKEKATFNLPKDLLSELEDKCHEMRKICRSKQVSKTLIVEEALKMAFADFETKRQNSKFFQRLSDNKAIKQ